MPGPAIDYTKKQIRIKTRLGDMVLRFYPDVAPNTVKNFFDLAASGYYNGVIFHRVIKDFMIQGGDKSGTGRGTGQEKTIKCELNDKPHLKGALSMAHRGRDTGSTQFFIMHGRHASHLDRKHTVFGQLHEGMNVLDKIANEPVSPDGNRPFEDVVMQSVTIEDAR